MKKVYTHTFSDKRLETDDVIDQYFEDTLGIKTEASKFDKKKYKAWLTLFDKPDNKKSMRDFKEFMQHEMQHEN